MYLGAGAEGQPVVARQTKRAVRSRHARRRSVRRAQPRRAELFPGVCGRHLHEPEPRWTRCPTPTHIRQTYGEIVGASSAGVHAGLTETGYNLSAQGWDELHVPDLHAGDTTPARIYAAEGDVVTTGAISLPKQTVGAGGSIMFTSRTTPIQHNSEQDLSLIRAGDGLYFSRQRLCERVRSRPSGSGDRQGLLDARATPRASPAIASLFTDTESERPGAGPGVASRSGRGGYRHQHRLQPAAELRGASKMLI